MLCSKIHRYDFCGNYMKAVPRQQVKKTDLLHHALNSAENPTGVVLFDNNPLTSRSLDGQLVRTSFISKNTVLPPNFRLRLKILYQTEKQTSPWRLSVDVY